MRGSENLRSAGAAQTEAQSYPPWSTDLHTSRLSLYQWLLTVAIETTGPSQCLQTTLLMPGMANILLSSLVNFLILPSRTGPWYQCPS